MVSTFHSLPQNRIKDYIKEYGLAEALEQKKGEEKLKNKIKPFFNRELLSQ
jgi:hypothetical protein